MKQLYNVNKIIDIYLTGDWQDRINKIKLWDKFVLV